MRHASARAHGESDRDRELSRAGRAEATHVARQLAHAGLCPDRAVVSDALRARQTWAAVERECGDCEVSYDEALYAASAETVLEELRLLPEEAGTVAYIGHNPAAAYLAAVLSGGEGEPDALQSLIAGMPPGMAAVFELSGDWAGLAPGSARLLQVFRPGR